MLRPGARASTGAGTVGFDCSGLVLYCLLGGTAAALLRVRAVQPGPQDPVPADAPRRRHLRPNGSQHAWIGPGNGQMLEAPDVGFQRAGCACVYRLAATPYVVRYIEY